MFRVPCAIFVFNRPDLTLRLVDALRAVRPERVLVVADGPRGEGERALCDATRAALDAIDWPCRIEREFAESNMGCRRRLQTGLSWVFDRVDRAIVLEDDVLPDPSFFPFCEEMLERFAEDERVMSVSGDNFQFDRYASPYSYYYSRYVHIWGWATWRRAWRLYDPSMVQWPMLRAHGWLNDFLGDPVEARYWSDTFDSVYQGHVDTWDFQLVYAHWVNHALSVVPSQNLVSNLGFRADGTHTKAASPLSSLPTRPMQFPLGHPPGMVRNVAADAFYARHFLPAPGLLT